MFKQLKETPFSGTGREKAGRAAESLREAGQTVQPAGKIYLEDNGNHGSGGGGGGGILGVT